MWLEVWWRDRWLESLDSSPVSLQANLPLNIITFSYCHTTTQQHSGQQKGNQDFKFFSNSVRVLRVIYSKLWLSTFYQWDKVFKRNFCHQFCIVILDIRSLGCNLRMVWYNNVKQLIEILLKYSKLKTELNVFCCWYPAGYWMLDTGLLILNRYI